MTTPTEPPSNTEMEDILGLGEELRTLSRRCATIASPNQSLITGPQEPNTTSTLTASGIPTSNSGLKPAISSATYLAELTANPSSMAFSLVVRAQKLREPRGQFRGIANGFDQLQ